MPTISVARLSLATLMVEYIDMRKIRFAKDEYYHIFNRGVDKRIIFDSPQDYERFLYYLYLANSSEAFKLDNATKYPSTDSRKVFTTPRSQQLVAIHAYCLMSNHFHLLINERRDGGISAFMQKVSTAYTMYFNRKNKRSGSLFQGPFKAVHIENDTQFKYLFSYIHANPFSTIQKDGSVQIKDTEKVLEYDYSSIKEYRGEKRVSSPILAVLPFIQKELKTVTESRKHLLKWLDFHNS